MAGVALRSPVQRGVRLGKRARRYLRFGGGGQRERNAKKQKREKRCAFESVAQRSDEKRTERAFAHALLPTSGWAAAKPRLGCSPVRVLHTTGRRNNRIRECGESCTRDQ